MSITVKQQWEEGESELEPSSNSQPIQSPREFSSVNAPTELLPIEANGPGLCAPTSVTGCVIPWGREQGSFLQLKAILRQGLSLKLPRVNIPEARRMNILALKCVSSRAHQSIYCACKKRGI